MSSYAAHISDRFNSNARLDGLGSCNLRMGSTLQNDQYWRGELGQLVGRAWLILQYCLTQNGNVHLVILWEGISSEHAEFNMANIGVALVGLGLRNIRFS